MTDSVTKNEYSVEVDLTSVPQGGKEVRMVLTEDECIHVAKRLRVIRVKSCDGEIKLSMGKATVSAEGLVRAELVRECVSSLEEVNELVNDHFDIEFRRDDNVKGGNEEIEEWGLPDIHEGSIFDVGELLIQQLSLAMVPFPRKPGAKSLAEEYGVEPEVSPFAVLQQNIKKE